MTSKGEFQCGLIEKCFCASFGAISTEDVDSQHATDWKLTDAEVHTSNQLSTRQHILGSYHVRPSFLSN